MREKINKMIRILMEKFMETTKRRVIMISRIRIGRRRRMGKRKSNINSKTSRTSSK